MDRKPIVSSNLVSVGYGEAPGSTRGPEDLDIEFKGGTVYRYFKVPLHIYQGLISAQSAGSYHHQNIKGVYDYVKL